MREQQHNGSITIEFGVLTSLRRLHTEYAEVVREQYHMCLSYLTKSELEKYSNDPKEFARKR